MKVNIFNGRTRHIILIIFDVLVFAAVNFLYFLLLKNDMIFAPTVSTRIYIFNALFLLSVTLLLRCFVFGIYNNIWRYTNTSVYFRVIISDVISAILSIFSSAFVIERSAKGFYIGPSYTIFVTSLCLIAVLMSRFSYRLLYKAIGNHKVVSSKITAPVAIVGAGQLGAYLASELLNSNTTQYRPVCFIDIDANKIKKNVVGLPVYSADNAEEVISEYGISDIILAVKKINSDEIDALWKHYTALGCKFKIYDSPLNDDSKNRKRQIRDFAIEDLLFRQPLSINNKDSVKYYENKTILITGGGGSIGSEICRQIAKMNPKKLVIFDIYENNAYEIQQSLLRMYQDEFELVVEIGSVRDKTRLEYVYKKHLPDVVFHAAAHKHVPLMEHSACEAIKNNVFGTLNTIDLAEKYDVKKFILISTDKAVNPTNVMGASKRVCEMLIQSRNDSKTSFSAVRFGNVLGSNGSVIPLFKDQIAKGGPITITDKRIIRYFMTIPEASQLVIEAGAMAKQGELFVLDMGKPIKIYDLAVNMIRLSGYEPEKEIEIKEIGLRPGEKLYEELLMKSETLYSTKNNMIFIEKDAPHTRAEVEQKLDVLKAALDEFEQNMDSTVIKNAFMKTVPTYSEAVDINKDAVNSEEMKLVSQS